MAGITDKEVRALIANAQKEGKTLTQADGMIAGLTFTASKAGTGAWVLRYRIAGKQKEYTIGKFPVWGIADARKKAGELKRAADDGADVAVLKKQAKQAAMQAWTINDLAESYFEKIGKDLAPHTLSQRKRIFEKYIKPSIGTFPIALVKPENVVHVLDKCKSAGHTIPRHVLVALSQMFFYGVARAVCSSNPCRDVRADSVTGKPPAPNHGTALTEKQLTAFLPALKTIPRPYDLTIRLMLLTGVRVGVITSATWSEFDLAAGIWSIPHDHRKNRKHTSGPFEIKLPSEAIDWLKELHFMAAGDVHVLPSETRRVSVKPHALGKRNTIGNWLDRMHANSEGWPRITPHDLRRTCKTSLSANGIEDRLGEMYLDHATGLLKSTYDKWQKCPERYVASEKLLRFLNSCEHGQKINNVVPLIARVA